MTFARAVQRASLLPRAFVSGALIIQGAGMILASRADYSSPGYRVVFDLAPRITWGFAFAITGALLLAIRHPITLAAVIAVLFGWAIGLNAAWWSGDSTTPTAGISWLALALLTLWSAGRPGGVS